MADAKLTGRERTLARIEQLAPALIEQLAKDLDTESDALVAAWKRNAPVSHDDQPGQLRDSIRKYPTPGRKLSFRFIADSRDRKGRVYPRDVEFGHVAADGTLVPAEPFWFPIYRAFKKRMRTRALAGARKVIRQMFPKR